mgnify:CR=1 FL=1|jgi:uncharacterized phage-associated protein|nr:MAG TPA: hypothetical protein [Caudoviricetes sp.]
MAYKASDIAKLLIKKAEQVSYGEEFMTNMKLQKMLYYQQGFHLAYFGEPLFDEEIEAWMYGPVVPSVYDEYKSNGKNGIRLESEFEFEFKSKEEEALFNEVFKVYGVYSALGLMNMTHSEAPWKNTKTGEGNVIPKSKIKTFFRTRLKK